MNLGSFLKRFLSYPVKFSYFIDDDSVAEDVITDTLLMDKFVFEYKNYIIKDFEVSVAPNGYNLYVEIGK